MSTSVLLPIRRFVAPDSGGVLIVQDLPNYVRALAAAYCLRNLSPIPPAGVECEEDSPRVRLIVWAPSHQVGAIEAAIGPGTTWRATLDIEGRWLALTPGASAPTIDRRGP